MRSFNQFIPVEVILLKETETLQVFEDQPIRTAWDEAAEEWNFSIVDVVGILTESKDAAAYWRKLKQRLKEEGNETVTNCHALKMKAADGKRRATDVATTEQTNNGCISRRGGNLAPVLLSFGRWYTGDQGS